MADDYEDGDLGYSEETDAVTAPMPLPPTATIDTSHVEPENEPAARLRALDYAPADTWTPEQGTRVYNFDVGNRNLTPSEQARERQRYNASQALINNRSLAPQQQQVAQDEIELMRNRPFTQADAVRLSMLNNGVATVQAQLDAGEIDVDTARKTLRQIYTPMGVLQAQKQMTEAKIQDAKEKSFFRIEKQKQLVEDTHELIRLGKFDELPKRIDPITGETHRLAIGKDGEYYDVDARLREQALKASGKGKVVEKPFDEIGAHKQAVAFHGEWYPEAAMWEEHPAQRKYMSDEAKGLAKRDLKAYNEAVNRDTGLQRTAYLKGHGGSADTGSVTAPSTPDITAAPSAAPKTVDTPTAPTAPPGSLAAVAPTLPREVYFGDIALYAERNHQQDIAEGAGKIQALLAAGKTIDSIKDPAERYKLQELAKKIKQYGMSVPANYAATSKAPAPPRQTWLDSSGP